MLKDKLAECFRNKAFRYLLLIFLLALSARTARYFLTNRIDKDSVAYIKISKDYLRKDFKYAFEHSPRMPPLYIFMMAGGEKIGIDAYYCGLIVSIFFGSIIVFAVFIAGKELFKDESLALLAALLAATHPFLVRLSADIMREPLFITLFAFSLAFVLLAIRKNFSWAWIPAGLFLGLADMVRSEAIEIIFVLFMWTGLELILNLKDYKKFLVKSACGIAIFLISFSAITFPVEYALRGSCSQWRVIDHRIAGYIDNFFNTGKKLVIKVEKD
jgi:4-amino-4-deoxy-L-arabinose transferase-like glycosyltransferase